LPCPPHDPLAAMERDRGWKNRKGKTALPHKGVRLPNRPTRETGGSCGGGWCKESDYYGKKSWPCLERAQKGGGSPRKKKKETAYPYPKNAPYLGKKRRVVPSAGRIPPLMQETPFVAKKKRRPRGFGGGGKKERWHTPAAERSRRQEMKKRLQPFVFRKKVFAAGGKKNGEKWKLPKGIPDKKGPGTGKKREE